MSNDFLRFGETTKSYKHKDISQWSGSLLLIDIAACCLFDNEPLTILEI